MSKHVKIHLERWKNPKGEDEILVNKIRCANTLQKVLVNLRKNDSIILYNYIPGEFKDEHEILLIMLHNLGKYSQPSFLSHHENNAEILGETSLINDRQFIINAASVNSYILKYAKKFNSDKEIIIITMERIYKDLIKAEHELRMYHCKDIYVHPILEHLLSTFTNIPELLKLNQEFMLDLLKKNPRIIIFGIPDLKSDGLFMLKAIEQYIDIRYDDEEFPFKHASYELKRNKEFILKALGINGNILSIIDSDLQKNPEYLIKAFCGYITTTVSRNYIQSLGKEDWLIIFENCKNIIYTYTKIEIPYKVKTDRDIILIVLRRDASGSIYESFSEIDKRKPEYLMTMLSNHGILYIKLSRKIQSYKDEGYITDEFMKELQLAALKTCGRLVPHLYFTSNINYSLIAVRQDGNNIKYLTPEMKDMRIMIAAQAQCVSKDECCMKYFPTLYYEGLFIEKLEIILGSDSFKRDVKDICLFKKTFPFFLLASSHYFHEYSTRHSQNILNKLNSHGKFHALTFKKKIYEYYKPICMYPENLAYIKELLILSVKF
jgi:hypothetical protein